MRTFLEITGGVFWIAVFYAVASTINEYQMTGTWWWQRRGTQ